MKCLLLIVSNFSLFTQWCRGMFSHKLKLVVFWRTVFYSSLFLFTYFLVCTWLEVFLPSSSGWGSQQSSRNKQLSFFSYRQEKEKVVGWKGKCSHSGAIRLIKVYSRVIPSLSLSLYLFPSPAAVSSYQPTIQTIRAEKGGLVRRPNDGGRYPMRDNVID
jgi:hypothetical protein